MDLHFVDANGNHFVVPVAPEGYARDDDAVQIDPPSSPEHRYIDGAWAIPELLPQPAEIDAERDRRINGGFRFAGTEFQTRPADRENILGAVSLATLAVMLGGKKPGDLRWHDGASDFAWIAADNSLVTMDAPTVIAFGQAAAEHKSAHTFAARALKDAETIPADFADDKHWPAP